MVYCEFQAVILAAGRGSRMTDLTAGIPKCLLPVGGKPILCHTIRTLEKAGFRDVLIVVLENESNEISAALQNNVKIHFELVHLPSDCEDWGTADSLKYLISQDKIKSDILLVSCDIFTNGSLQKLLNTYRQHAASFAALFFLPIQTETFQVPGTKSKYKAEKDIIGIDLASSRLMFLASASDFEENVSISTNILRRHPKLNLRTDLTDGHVYLLSQKLAKYLVEEKNYSSIKGEFLPHVVAKQFAKKPTGNEEASVVNEAAAKKTIAEYMKRTKLEENIIDLSTYNDHDGDLKSAYHGDVVRCYAVLGDQNEFGIRINCLQALCQANRLCTDAEEKVGPEIIGVRISPTTNIQTNQIDSLSFLGPHSQIREKTSIKTSAIGEKCTVNSKTRITRCIILNNVEIEEGCVLENCIIGNDTKIGKDSDLKNCFVGPNYCVPNKTVANSQVLTKSEGLMEI